MGMLTTTFQGDMGDVNSNDSGEMSVGFSKNPLSGGESSLDPRTAGRSSGEPVRHAKKNPRNGSGPFRWLPGGSGEHSPPKIKLAKNNGNLAQTINKI